MQPREDEDQEARRSRGRAQAIFPGALAILREIGTLLRVGWRIAAPVLRAAVQIFLALFILLEEWGWRPLADLLGRLARWQPWARLEYGIARLPPYAALLVFILPSAVLLPLKFLALFLVARGQFVLAAILFAAAKVLATALVARLFLLTQPALMQIGWFAWSYETLMPWKEALVERVRASTVWRLGRLFKERTRRAIVAQWRLWRPLSLKVREGVRRLAVAVRQWLRRVRAAE